MVKDKEEAPYGYIYKITNTINGKVYIGKTGKTIEERWTKHLENARALKRAREANPDKNIEGSHLNNAINKYGSNAFIVNQEDIAYSREELNELERYWVKEYDSMNPDKGYNMTEGGEGGRQSPEVIKKMTEISRERAKDPEWRKKVSEAGTKKWREDTEYREKQTKERQERGKDPEFLRKMTEINREREKNPDWLQKMTKINQEIARNPQVQEKMSRVMSEKWQEQKYQESVSKGVKEKWKDDKYRERQSRAKTEGKREIPDKGEFLKDIKEMMKKDINTKYDMDGKSINKRIEEMLKHQGVRTYSEAKKYLEDKDLNEVLKDIEKRQEMVKKPDFKEKMTEINRERAKDPDWLKKMREIGKQYRKEIPDKREFLNEIKGDMIKKDMLQKYDMGKNSFNKRIQEMFGPDGPKNYTELKNYMRDKNADDVLKEIEERNKEKEVKHESRGDDLKDKGESKSQDDIKEKTDKGIKSDEKEDLKEGCKEENEDNKSDNNKENSERNQNHENSDENLREKGEKSVEIEENIESKNKETMDEDTSKEEKENNVSDSEENKSIDSSNSEEEAKCGKNVEDMENLNLTVKDYAGIDKNSSEREQDITCLDGDQDSKNSSERAQDITCLDENQDSKNSGSTRYINLGNADIVSIEIVKDIKTDENKDYADIDEGGKKEHPDYAHIDNFLDKPIESEVIEDDKRSKRGGENIQT